MRAAKPAGEAERLRQLAEYDILDTLPEQAYDDITYVAYRICDAPIALMSLVDEDRQWFKSRIGLGVPETHRDYAFCAHAINEPTKLLEVRDATSDRRFADNPLVTGDPKIRFYAGAPLVTAQGAALGTLCVIDRVPRELTDEQRATLLALSRQVMAQLELRRAIADLRSAAAERTEYARTLEEYQRKLESAMEQLIQESATDPLTGLANRRTMEHALADEWERSTRYKTPLSVALLDLDHFKDYNDRAGHRAGDDALRSTARVLDETRRASDLAARYGGEEFIVILPQTEADGAYVVAERLRRAIEKGSEASGLPTASIGVATRTESKASSGDLVAAADQAMYQAKDGGRNRVVRAT